IRGVEARCAGVPDVVPADVVESAVRSTAERIGVERGLHKVLDRRVAGYPVIDYRPSIGAELLLEAIGPCLALGSRNVGGGAAAEHGDHAVALELGRGVLGPAGAAALL